MGEAVLKMHVAADPMEDLARLNDRFGGAPTRDLLAWAIAANSHRRIAMVSSFGANSVVLLHLVASIDRNLPVLFVDTGKLFGKTIAYRDALVRKLGLGDVRSIGPEPQALAKQDPHGALWMRDTDACCELRKVTPFNDALEEFDIWISGRKRYQGGDRNELPLFERDGRRVKINPLANWKAEDLNRYRGDFALPQHPLVADGYPSIGCEPCTSRVAAGEPERAGRWRGADKTECGIHVADNMGGLP